MFEISDCQTPNFDSQAGFLQDQCAGQFAKFENVSVQLYDFLRSRTRFPCISIQCFTRAASTLADKLLKKTQLFYDTMNTLLQSLRLFEGLTSSDTNYQRIDIEQFSIDTFNKAVI